jgi:hypothetical protein
MMDKDYYNKKAKNKIEICSSNNIKLIYLVEKDIKSLMVNKEAVEKNKVNNFTYLTEKEQNEREKKQITLLTTNKEKKGS